MKIPKRDVGSWARDLIDQCNVSKESRLQQYLAWKAYYFNGMNDAKQAPYNRIYSHIDRLSAFLFSADDIRFHIGFERTIGEPWVARAEASSRILNREFHRCGVDLEVSTATDWALVLGKSLVKLVWGHNGLEPWLIQPQFFGVLREDIDSLDRQEAFVHTTYVTPSEMDRQLVGHPEASRIKGELKRQTRPQRDEDEVQTSYFQQMVIGGVNPVQQNTAGSGKNMVSLSGVPSPYLDPKVVKDLLRVHELWVMDSDRDDYTTIRVVDPDIVIEGNLRHENMCGLKGEQPFREICPNRIDGYFWGASEITQIATLQDMLNESIRDISKLTMLKARPPTAFIGFSGMTEQRYKALNVPEGYISEDNPNAKIEKLAPEIPPELFEKIEKITHWFDDVGGFQPILMGQGEQGVRAGVHAQTLLRTGSPRMRDRALLVERQCASIGDLAFKYLQNKDATVFVSKKKEEFFLKQMPDDYNISVDSHSGSPVFQEDTERKAFMLAKAGAVDGPDLIMLTRPPHMDTLIEHAEAKAEAQAKLLREHPELLLKAGGKKR